MREYIYGKQGQPKASFDLAECPACEAHGYYREGKKSYCCVRCGGHGYLRKDNMTSLEAYLRTRTTAEAKAEAERKRSIAHA